MATTITYGSFNLNNQAAGYYVVEKPFSLTPITETFYKVARLEGQKRTSYVTNERQIALKMVVVSNISRADLENKLSVLYAALAPQQQPLTLYALDSRYVVCDCIAADASLAGGAPISAAVSLTFVAQQPYFLSTTTSTFDTGTVTLNTSGGGTYTFPTQTITGGGSIFSRPTVKLTKKDTTTWSSVTLTQQTDGFSLTVTSGLPSANGDFLEFNCDVMTTNGYSVLLNNAGSPLAFSGLFPVMEPTATQWGISINSGGQVIADANWSWVPRWL